MVEDLAYMVYEINGIMDKTQEVIEKDPKGKKKAEIRREIEEEAARVDLIPTANGRPMRSHPGSTTMTTSSTGGAGEKGGADARGAGEGESRQSKD